MRERLFSKQKKSNLLQSYYLQTKFTANFPFFTFRNPYPTVAEKLTGSRIGNERCVFGKIREVGPRVGA
jgi:hypothetical protein